MPFRGNFSNHIATDMSEKILIFVDKIHTNTHTHKQQQQQHEEIKL